MHNVGFAVVGWTIAVVGAAILSGQDRSGQDRVIAIRAGWLIDGTDRPPIADAVVVVRGNRIEAAGPRASVKVPDEAERIDLLKHAVLPGMVDTHSHLNLRSPFPSPYGGPTQRDAPASEQMLKVVRHARVQLLCGITTLRQVGELHYNDLLLRDAIAAGMHVGPRILSSALLVTVTGGHGYPGNWVEGVEGIRKLIRENKERGAEWIKISQTDQSPTTALLSPEEMKAAVDEAHKLGMKVTVHATGFFGTSMRSAIEAGVDNIEHAIPLTEEFVKMMVEKGITASLTPIVYTGWRPPPELYQVMDRGVNNCAEYMEHLAKTIQEFRTANPQNEISIGAPQSFMGDQAAARGGRGGAAGSPPAGPPGGRAGGAAGAPQGGRAAGGASGMARPGIKMFQQQYLQAYKLGLPFSLGLDAQYAGIPWSMEFLVQAGIPPLAAIRAGTSVAAKLVGLGDRLGTIEAGKLADLIAVEGNPVEDITRMRRLRFVMKDGQRYDTLSWR